MLLDEVVASCYENYQDDKTERTEQPVHPLLAQQVKSEFFPVATYTSRSVPLALFCQAVLPRTLRTPHQLVLLALRTASCASIARYHAFTVLDFVFVTSAFQPAGEQRGDKRGHTKKHHDPFPAEMPRIGVAVFAFSVLLVHFERELAHCTRSRFTVQLVNDESAADSNAEQNEEYPPGLVRHCGYHYEGFVAR